MTVCKELFEKMSEYLDGEMSLAMMKEAEKHLAHCTGCEETVKAFKKSISFLQRTRAKTLPEKEKKQLKELIQQEIQRQG